MRFICNKHVEKGEQLNSIDNVVNNHHYCKYCSYERMMYERITPKDRLVELCKSKNASYSGQYTRNHETVVQYQCDKHLSNGIQEMELTHFKESAVPCHYCGISSGELRIMEYLNSNNLNYKKEKSFADCVSNGGRKLRFDFYLPEYNIAIEYDGRQHFEPVTFWNGQDANKKFRECKENDAIKNEFCSKNNITLIRIPYWNYNKIDTILASELSDAFLLSKS